MSTEVVTYAIPIVVVVLVAILGSLGMSSIPKGGWYNNLKKSALTPPNWVFGVVWTILYGLIAAAWVLSNIEITDQYTIDLINLFFIINMILNLAWTYVSFVKRQLGMGLFIVFLMIASVCPIIAFTYTSPVVVSFVSVYLAWLVFAFYLNYQIYMMNENVSVVDSLAKLE